MEHTTRPTDLINREKAMVYCGNSEQLFKIILQSFHKQGLDYLEKLPQYFEAEDWNNYRIVVHALKSSALNIGAENFSAESKKQEFAVKENNLAFIPETFEEYYENFKSLMKVVEEML